MFFANVFYTKIVNDKSKTDGAGDVFPKAWGMGNFVVAVLGEALFEQFVG